jgi:hypothetical protein
MTVKMLYLCKEQHVRSRPNNFYFKIKKYCGLTLSRVPFTKVEVISTCVGTRFIQSRNTQDVKTYKCEIHKN